MKQRTGNCALDLVGKSFMVGTLLLSLSSRLLAAGVPVGQSALLGASDYSDTFTLGTASRPGIFHYTNPDAVDAYYNVESGSPVVQWRRTSNFSFNIAGNTVGEYPGSTGNAGASSGLAQSGGNSFNFAYGKRDHFIVQADALFVCDHVMLGCYANVGDQRGAANSLAVLFRRGAISLHNGTETATGLSTGIAAADSTWHNFAVEFDKTFNLLSFYVDEALVGTLDLVTFAGGLYKNYSNAAVGAGVSGYVGWVDNFQVGAPAVSVSSLLIDSHRTEPFSTPDARLIGTVIDAGRLIKQGAGTLRVDQAHLCNGAVEVAAGTLELGDGVCELPLALRAGLAFWVDANSNVEVSGNEVTAWYDVREAPGGTNYARARKFGADPAPIWVQGGADVAGHKLVDFGAYGAGPWLQWQDAASNRLSLANIRTVFLAVSCTNGYGFLLGDWDNAIANTNAGTGDFHAGGNTGEGNPSGQALKNASWWSPASAAYPVRNGQTFVNGEFINGAAQAVPEAGAVMSLLATGNAQASNFGNNRNFKASQGLDGVLIDRQGGGRIGEALIYTTALTKSQRCMVEAYLMKKWLGRGLGVVRIAEGASLALQADADKDISSATMSGLGTLAVQGAGRLVATNGSASLPPIRLGIGTSADNGTQAQIGQPFILEAGSAYAVSNGICTRQALADGDLIEKTGDGMMSAVNIPSGVRRVSVKGGTLRLAPPQPGAPNALTNALGNASFETFTSVGTGGTANWGYSPEGTGWTLRGDMTSANGAEWSGVGLAKPAAGVPWCATQPAPDGNWVIFLKRAGELERTFEIPVSGRYEIAFHTAARPNYAYHLYQVLVDDTQVIGSVRTPQTGFSRISCVTPPLAAGTHTLCFKGAYGSSDRASLIDGIEITLLNDAGVVAVPNGGFEEPGVLTGVAYAGATSFFDYNPTGAVWSFVGDPAVTNSGITEGNGPWYYAHMAQGDRAAFLRQTGELSVPVTFPTSGLYRLSFRAAGRAGYWANLWGYTWYNGHNFDVQLGTSQIARVTTWSPTFDLYTFMAPAINDGDPLTQTLTFKGVNSGGGDRATLLDDVCFSRLSQIDNPGFETAAALANGTWEAGITNAGWAFCVGAAERGQSGIAKSGSDWGNTAPEGGCNAFLQMTATIGQDVSFSEDGTYTLSFLAAGRSQLTRYLGHDFRVLFNSVSLGYVRTDDGVFRRYSFRLPRVKAGVSYALVFEGLNRGDETDRASFLDSVMYTRLEEPAFVDASFAKTGIDLSAGTSLLLDYDGVLPMAYVFHNGLSFSGTLNEENTPFIQGGGSLYVTPKGTLFSLR